MLHRVDWSLATLVFVSLFFLAGVVYVWWTGELPFFPQEVLERESSFSQIQMEKAEISRVGEKGKEWVLNAHSVEQKGDDVFLIDVSGVFFQEGIPLYQVKAQKGQIFLSEGDVELQKVKLINEEKKETLQGELLLWRGKEEKFELSEAQFAGQGIEASCQQIIYNISKKKLLFENNVELKIKVEE